MRRRDLLAGAAGLTVVGSGAAYAIGDLSLTREDGAGTTPVELSGIEAPGSEKRTVTIPEQGQVNFVELFATSCPVCQRMMPELRDAAATVDDVQFVSVTNEPLGHTIDVDDVAEWWADHDGNWQLAHDDGLELTQTLDANAVPYSVVFDADNQLVWSDDGYKTAEELLDTIETAPH